MALPLARVRGPGGQLLALTPEHLDAEFHDLSQVGISSSENRTLAIEDIRMRFCLGLYATNTATAKPIDWIVGLGNIPLDRRVKYIRLHRRIIKAKIRGPQEHKYFYNTDVGNWYNLEGVGIEGLDRIIDVKVLEAGYKLSLNPTSFSSNHHKIMIDRTGERTVPARMENIRLETIGFEG